MLGHAKKTTDTTFTIFYNQQRFALLTHNLTHFLHSIVRLAMCPAKLFHFMALFLIMA